MKHLVFLASLGMVLCGILGLASLRTLSGAPIAIICLGFLILFTRWKPRLDILSLSIVGMGLIYVALSYTTIFVDSWSPYRDREVIMRQAHYVVLFPFMVVGFRSLIWIATIRYRVNIVAWIFAAASFSLIARLVRSGFEEVLPYGLGNTASIFIGCLVILLARIKYLWSTVFVALAIFSSGAQNILLYCFLTILPIVRHHRHVFAAVFMLPLVGIALLPILQEVYSADANSGVRLLFLIDALRALADSFGMGVGYGTWGIRNYYLSFTFVDPTVGTVDLFNISIHNSLFGLAMRLGCIVFILYGAMVYILWRDAAALNEHELRVATALGLIVALSIAVNVSIESPTYSVGTAFIFALLDCFVLSKYIRNRYLSTQARRRPIESRFRPKFR